MDPRKIQAMKEWPQPKNVSKLQGFLGLTGYYRRFIKNYAHVTALLTNPLKRNSFLWDDEARRCNVPPSFQDGGTWEQGNAHSGRVETTPKSRDIRGDMGTSLKL